MTTTTAAVTKDFKTTPYWWDDTPIPDVTAADIPKQTDIVIIGGGLSGLMVALDLARSGLEVTVFDAGYAGEHASTRNFGAIGRTIRLGFSELERRYGLEFATRVYQEARGWVDYTADFIERENIECRFKRAGRVIAAHCAKAYESSARELETMSRYLEVDTFMLPRDQQHLELGSTVYHGCAVYTDVGHLDPGRYHAAVKTRAESAGAKILNATRVTNIERDGAKFRVKTDRGITVCDQVVLATNAETGVDNALFKYFHRRTLPVSLYSAVSEPLPVEVMERVFPTARTVLETRRLYTGIRPLVGENRLLVVSQHLVQFASPVEAAHALRKDLEARYPELANIKFSHVWEGRFCITFDWLPHMGSHEGVHYLHGLNGAGVPACGYLGHKLAQRILGHSDGDSVFADRLYPKRTGYRGNAWFLPFIGHLYRALDRRESGLSR